MQIAPPHKSATLTAVSQGRYRLEIIECFSWSKGKWS
jgi:hypothetical protein